MVDAGRTRIQFEPERFLKSVTLRQIRYFVAAAEFGKVSLAASMISISTSAVTEAINELENNSGVQLFERHPRGLSLTYEGRRFLLHCRRILAAVKDASFAFGMHDDAVEGTFTLAASSTVVGYFISPLLARFRSAFPNVEVRLVEGDRTGIVQGLLRGDHDLAVAIVSNIPPRPELECQTLIRSARRLWLSPQHPFAKRAAVSLDEIATEPYIQLTIDGTEHSTTRYWREKRKTPKIVFRSESVEAVRSLIAYGHGLTILSDMMYRPWSLEGDRVEVREVKERIPTMDTGLLWRGETVSNPAAERFRAFCRLETSPQLGA